MKRLITSSLLAASILALGFGEANAVDRKVKAGSECVRWNGATPGLSYSSVYNPSSTTSVSVDCPITRDVGANKGIKLARVRVLDNHSTQQVKCQLVSTYRSPSTKKMLVKSTGSDYSVNGADTLQFNEGSKRVPDGQTCTYYPFYPFGKHCHAKYKYVPTPAVEYADSYSHAYLSCVIPPRFRGAASAIDSYLVDENN